MKRTDDAAFLFFAAKIRAGADLKAFPPIGNGGNSPSVALSAVSFTIGAAVNPAVMRDRDSYARVLARIEKWTPKFTDGYRPGWEFKNPLPLEKRNAIALEFRDERTTGMRGINKLLQNDEYHALARKIQDYSLGEDVVQKIDNGRFPWTKVGREEFEQAKQRATEIEKQLGIEGVFYRKKTTKK